MTTLRIEFRRGGRVFAAEELAVGAVSAQSSAAPDFGGVPGKVRLTAQNGAAYVSIGGTNPTAALATGRFLKPDTPREFPIATGEKVAAIAAAAGNAAPVAQRGLTPLGYEKITSLSAAAGLTVPAGATQAWIRVESQGIRWRDDGTDPTASLGWPVLAGEVLKYDGSLSAFKAIETAASAALSVTYYKQV